MRSVAEVGGTWGGAQTIGGPVLTVPYRYTWIDCRRQGASARSRAPISFQRRSRSKARWSPNCGARPVRSRRLQGASQGHGTLRAARTSPRSGRRREQILWDEATLNIGVADPRGIAGASLLKWNGGATRSCPGVDDVGLFASGLHAPAPGWPRSRASRAVLARPRRERQPRAARSFRRGSETSVQLTSTLAASQLRRGAAAGRAPSDANGFSAHVARALLRPRLSAAMDERRINRDQMKTLADASAFGVSLMQPVDIYQQAERAVKYASLFIVMTFVIAFLWEIVSGALLHPIQYLFVGFAMCVFYLLLLSLSEHIGFDRAYASRRRNHRLLAWYWSRSSPAAWNRRADGSGTVRALRIPLSAAPARGLRAARRIGRIVRRCWR